ncbi:toxin C-terminal domain-containing protein [Mucilaginibacter sp. X4EP1]|uniref:toxin C-terminal domain-containing protein n=1 Tax=Mucilaginibacter sp. X4EP1 TaxID=2723092 RepID=UPI002167239A|nr:toxin C-terminal domain-containing protein [Mucilaginibacter sp. X4EP1]MCS3816662.1 hypothetical protein [Mucilaginibacter sp. X4EP1]
MDREGERPSWRVNYRDDNPDGPTESGNDGLGEVDDEINTTTAEEQKAADDGKRDAQALYNKIMSDRIMSAGPADAPTTAQDGGISGGLLDIPSRINNVPKWLWAIDTFDQEVPVLDVITDAATLYYLLHDKPILQTTKEELPDGLKETKDFGKQHGQKVYRKGNKYYSPDVDEHNGGKWKVFEKVGGKLKRVGTADKDLNIFKK